MKKLVSWIKKASRSNRVFRTAVQGFCSYMAVNLPTFWDGSGDIKVAFEALLVGALAAGISAVWRTAESDLQNLQEKGAS